MLSAALAQKAIGSVIAGLADIAHEVRLLRRSIDHHAIVSSRPELWHQALDFYSEGHGLIK